MSKKMNEKQARLIHEEYKQGSTLRMLGKKYNYSYVGISNVFKRFNLETRPPSRIPKLETNKLITLGNYEDAYWLGFLCGDGYISKSTFALYLNEGDKEHINKCIQYLGINPKIRVNNKTNCHGFNISAKLWYPLVKRNGLEYLKTNRFIPDLKPELMGYFWRGLFDADGGIHKRVKNVTFSCPYQYANGFREWIGLPGRGNGGLAGTFYKRSDKTYEVRYGGRINSLKVLRKVYFDDKIYLERKYEMFELYEKTIDNPNLF